MEKREALIDGINMLRAVCVHSLSDMELLIHTMYSEQRANLRTLKSAKCHGHPLAHMTKGILIRARFYKHLALSFPEFAADLTEFVDNTCFKTYFGIDENGRIDAAFKRDDGSDDGGDDPDVIRWRWNRLEESRPTKAVRCCCRLQRRCCSANMKERPLPWLRSRARVTWSIQMY